MLVESIKQDYINYTEEEKKLIFDFYFLMVKTANKTTWGTDAYSSVRHIIKDLFDLTKFILND